MVKKFLRGIKVSFLLLIIISTLSSCANEMNIFEGNNNKQINFFVSVPEWKNTDSLSSSKTSRAIPISDASLSTSTTFNIIADQYDGMSSYTTLIDKESVIYTNNIWKTSNNYYWSGTANKTVNFYAYYPTSISGNISHTAGSSPTLLYTVPSDVSNQIDIITAINPNVSGSTETSTPLTFNHIFAAVKFAVGTSGLPSGTIKSITINGIKNSGTYTFGSGWTVGSTTSSLKVSPSTTIRGTSGENITTDAFTLMMIPQSFTSATITLTYDTGTEYKQTISGNWAANNIYTYQLSKPVNIGDYYYDDGTWGTIAEHVNSTARPIAVIFSNTTSTTDNGHKWTHGYGMALTNASSSAKWGTYGQDTPLENLNIKASGWIYVSNLKDGYTNTQTIKNTYALSSTSYPSFYYAVNYAINYPLNSSGWFLPSIGQWSDICINIGKILQSPDDIHYNGLIWYSASLSCIDNINLKLLSIGNLGYDISKFSIEDRFWISNEADVSSDAFYIYFSDNLYFDQNVNDGLRKNGSWNIRPVIAF